MNDQPRTPWREVDSPPYLNGALQPLLNTVDALRKAWEDALQDATAEERDEARNRRLRRHAIETGIIERLYDVDWGVTEALVAEGLTSEVANRAGGLNDDALQVIRSQYDALQYLTELVSNDRGLSVQTIREIHILITRHQSTYEAHDQFGRGVNPPLRHGEWKLDPNHVRRPDGTLFEYVPPEQVEPQIALLARLFNDAADVHPIVLSAWLHHRFICIHPFEDGNGRVARALTLLVLLRTHYAPLVVDRRERDAYINALDAANTGDLSVLVRLFARLEIVALQSTLTHPVRQNAEADAAGVIQAYARRLRELASASIAEKERATKTLAVDVHARISGYLDEQREELERALRDVDVAARASVFGAAPPDERARYWRRQLIQAARSIDFYANLANGAWWVRLHLEALSVRLRYIAAVQKVGHGETGVLAVTVYAELTQPESDETTTAVEPEPVLELAPTDSVTLAYTDQALERWPEIEELIRRTLREATSSFVDRLG